MAAGSRTVFLLDSHKDVFMVVNKAEASLPKHHVWSAMVESFFEYAQMLVLKPDNWVSLMVAKSPRIDPPPLPGWCKNEPDVTKMRAGLAQAKFHLNDAHVQQRLLQAFRHAFESLKELPAGSAASPAASLRVVAVLCDSQASASSIPEGTQFMYCLASGASYDLRPIISEALRLAELPASLDPSDIQLELVRLLNSSISVGQREFHDKIEFQKSRPDASRVQTTDTKGSHYISISSTFTSAADLPLTMKQLALRRLGLEQLVIIDKTRKHQRSDPLLFIPSQAGHNALWVTVDLNKQTASSQTRTLVFVGNSGPERRFQATGRPMEVTVVGRQLSSPEAASSHIPLRDGETCVYGIDPDSELHHPFIITNHRGALALHHVDVLKLGEARVNPQTIPPSDCHVAHKKDIKELILANGAQTHTGRGSHPRHNLTTFEALKFAPDILRARVPVFALKQRAPTDKMVEWRSRSLGLSQGKTSFFRSDEFEIFRVSVAPILSVFRETAVSEETLAKAKQTLAELAKTKPTDAKLFPKIFDPYERRRYYTQAKIEIHQFVERYSDRSLPRHVSLHSELCRVFPKYDQTDLPSDHPQKPSNSEPDKDAAWEQVDRYNSMNLRERSEFQLNDEHQVSIPIAVTGAGGGAGGGAGHSSPDITAPTGRRLLVPRNKKRSLAGAAATEPSVDTGTGSTPPSQSSGRNSPQMGRLPDPAGSRRLTSYLIVEPPSYSLMRQTDDEIKHECGHEGSLLWWYRSAGFLREQRQHSGDGTPGDFSGRIYGMNFVAQPASTTISPPFLPPNPRKRRNEA